MSSLNYKEVAFVPQTFADDRYLGNLKKHFTLGMLVTGRIVQFNSTTKQFILSLRVGVY